MDTRKTCSNEVQHGYVVKLILLPTTPRQTPKGMNASHKAVQQCVPFFNQDPQFGTIWKPEETPCSWQRVIEEVQRKVMLRRTVPIGVSLPT